MDWLGASLFDPAAAGRRCNTLGVRTPSRLTAPVVTPPRRAAHAAIALLLCLPAAAAPASTQPPLRAGTVAGRPAAGPIAAGPSSPNALDTPDTPDTLLIEVRLANVAAAVMLAVRSGGHLYLPLSEICHLVGLPPANERSRSSRSAGARGGRGERLPLRCPDERASGDASPVAREDRPARSLALARLGVLLPVLATVDWPALTVTLEDTAALLPATRLALLRSRAAKDRASPDPRPDLTIGWRGARAGTATIEYDVVRTRGAWPLLSGRLGATLFGGTLAARILTARSAVVQGVSWALERSGGEGQSRRLSLGMLYPRDGAPVTGLAFASAPTTGAARAPVLGLRLPAESGSLIEIVQDGATTTIDSAGSDGLLRRTLPLHPGANVVTLRTYAPRSAVVVRETERLVFVHPDQLPRGTHAAEISAGRCTAARACAAALVATGSWGAAPRLTLSAALRATAGGVAPGFAFAPGAVARLSDAITVSGSIGRRSDAAIPLRSRTPAAVQFLAVTPTAAVSAAMETGTEHPRTAVTLGWRARSGAAAASLGPWAFTLAADAAGTRLDLRSSVRATPRIWLRPTLGVSSTHLGTRSVMLGADADVRLAGLCECTARASLPTGRVARPALALSAAVRSVGRIEASASWPAFSRIPTVALGVARSGTAFDLASDVVMSRGGLSGMSQRLRGALVVSPGPRVIAADARATASSATVAGHLFLDSDSDSEHDPGEPGLPGVSLQVGATTTVSGADGAFRVSGVSPSLPLLVGIDTAGPVPDGYAARFTTIRVTPAGVALMFLELPFVPAATVTGRAILPNGAPAGPVLLSLRTTGDPGHGTEPSTPRRVFPTFSDGTFAVGGVPVGEYVIELAPDAACSLRAAAVPVPVRISVHEGRASAGPGVVLSLRPDPALPAAGAQLCARSFPSS